MNRSYRMMVLGGIAAWLAVAGNPAMGQSAAVEPVPALPQLCDFEMRRITSADSTGGNRDWRVLPPGQTLTLAEINGPGEIVHIDGKHAMQGTGSEDYFCESYGLREGCFPYFGVPINQGQFTSAYRWHLLDPVPFKESIQFLIEQGNGSPPFRSGNYYYSVAYWYQTEPHAGFPTLPSVKERISWAEPGTTPK